MTYTYLSCCIIGKMSVWIRAIKQFIISISSLQDANQVNITLEQHEVKRSSLEIQEPLGEGAYAR